MKRSTAQGRHRTQVLIIAALSGVILVLLYSVVPRVETTLRTAGRPVSPAAELVFDASHAVRQAIWLIAPLTACVIGLLWTVYGILDRGARSPRPDQAD